MATLLAKKAPTTRNDILYDIRGLCKYYGEGDDVSKVLNQVNFSIYSGQVYLFFGPNGCGKTKLMQLIAGFDQPTSGIITYFHDDGGRYVVDSEDSTLIDWYRQYVVSPIFQSKNLVSHMTLRENIELINEMVGKDFRHEQWQACDYYSRLLGIDKYLDMKADKVSGGQQQLASIIRALVSDRRVILADEPTASLDIKKKETAMKLLRTMADRTKKSLILVSHDVKEVNKMIDVFVYFVPHREGGYHVEVSEKYTPELIFR